MDEQLRMAAIGARGLGKGHVAAVVAEPRVRLAAVADIAASAAQDTATRHGGQAYTDYALMLEREDLDAAIISTPHHLHAPMALACLDAGLHVYVEKPLSIRVSEADRVVQKAREQRLVLAVGHQYRTYPANVRLKQLIEGGRIGSVSRVVWQWLDTRPEAYYDRDVWRCTWEHAGGGVLMNQASHDLDLLCWLIGDPVEVSAMLHNQGHRHEVEDTAIASIRFSSGALASAQFSTCSHSLNHREISGDRGTILLQDEKDPNVCVPQTLRLGSYDAPVDALIGESPRITGRPAVAWDDIDCAVAESPTLFDSFVTAILEGGVPITDGPSAHRTIELINAIILSGVRKKVVELPVDRGEYDELMDALVRGEEKIGRP